MSINIHSDPRFEKILAWLSRREGKTKTDLLKELVFERYHWKREGFQFGSLRLKRKKSSKAIQASLKSLDRDHDLD